MRSVAEPVRAAASQLLAGSIFARLTPVEAATLWVHTDDASLQIRFGEPILLGRTAPAVATNFLRVDSDKVSREHCGVRVVDGAATCIDLGSTNGTWIDRGGELIEVHANPVEIHAGDKICTMVNRIVLAEITATNGRP